MQKKTLATENQIKILQKNMSGDKISEMLKYYKVKKIEELSIEQASQVIKKLDKKGE